MLALMLVSAAALIDKEAAELNFHGVVRVERGRQVLQERGYGVAATTSFWVASISKSFTAALILRLRDLGKLRLDDPISRWVPDSGGITVDDLLTHTSGLPGATYVAEGITDADQAARAILAQSRGERGKFAYTNDGFALLAIIAQKAGGAGFFELLRREILDRAGLRHTGFWPVCLPGVRIAPLSRPPTGPRAEENWGFKGGDGMCSTAQDLSRFIRALADGKILSKETLDLLWAKAVPLSKGFAGRGFFIDGGCIWTRGTEDYGHNAVVKWFPREKVLIVALSDVPAVKRSDIAASRAMGDALEQHLAELR